MPVWLRVAVVPLVTALVVLGVWVTGGVLTNDFRAAMLLTGLWFAAAGAAALVAGLRWRALALPVIATYAVVSTVVGGGLLYTSHHDVTVDEAVVMVDTTTDGGTAVDPDPVQRKARAVGRGTFVAGEHETTGTATLVEQPDRSRVVTLTDFATSPGPDLRVYLVPGDGTSRHGFVDLGRLKGNKGNQQYDVAPGSPAGAVVVWCRAFSVAFGHARLS